MEQMFTVEAIAKRFNVSPRTVVRLIEKRQLRALRVGRQWRVSQEWLDAWLQRNTTEVGQDAG